MKRKAVLAFMLALTVAAGVTATERIDVNAATTFGSDESYSQNTYTADGITWEYDEYSVEKKVARLKITAVDGEVTTLTIPSTINAMDVVEVVAPEPDVLGKLSGTVTEVVIPSTIEYIGAGAFKGFTSLNTITLEKNSNLVCIGDQAFANCGFTRLTLDGQLAEILEKSFQNERQKAFFTGNTKLTSVQIISSDKYTVPTDMFNGCTNLTTLTTNECTGELVLGVRSFSGCNLKKLNFADSKSVQIRTDAFAYNANLESVVFGEVADIGESAFNGCGSMKNADFKNTTESATISAKAFGGTGITSLEIGAKNVTMCPGSLTGMTSLAKVAFGGNDIVTLQGTLVNASENNITNITFDSKEVTVSEAATPFSNMQNLTLTFGKNVEKISGAIGAADTANTDAFTDVYLYNPDTVIAFSDAREGGNRAYNVYGYTYSNNEGIPVVENAGMQKWAEAASGEETLKQIQEVKANLIVNPVAIELADGLYEGQTVDSKIKYVRQTYVDGSIDSSLTKSTDGNPYHGYVISYGEDKTALATGENVVTITYCDFSTELPVEATALDITSYDIGVAERVKTLKEGQTISKEDFFLTNVKYNGLFDADGNVTSGYTVTAVDKDGYEIEDFVFAGTEGKDATVLSAKDYYFKTVAGNGEIAKIYKVTVAETKICALEVTLTDPDYQWFVGDTVTKETFDVTAKYDNGIKTIEHFKNYQLSKETIDRNQDTITLSLIVDGNKITQDVTFTAKDVELTGISATPKDGYVAVEGESIDVSDLIVMGKYNHGADKPLTEEELAKCEVTHDAIKDGEEVSVRVQFQGKSSMFSVTGVKKAVSSISVITREQYEVGVVTPDTPTAVLTKKYYVGEEVSAEEFVIILNYNNHTCEYVTKGFEIKNNKLEAECNNVEFVYVVDGKEFTTRCIVNAEKVVFIKLSVAYEDKTITEGEEIDKKKLHVEAVYSNRTVTLQDDKYELFAYETVAGKEVRIKLMSELDGEYRFGEIVLSCVAKVTATPTPTTVVTPERPVVTATPTPTTVVTVTPVPTKAATVTPVPTTVVTPERPVVTATAEPTKAATPTPTTVVTVTPVPTKKATPTPTKSVKFTYKSSLSSIKLVNTTAKTKYTKYVRKKFTITLKGTNVQYQIVKSGKKLSSKAWKTGTKVTINTDMKARIYIRYTEKGKIVTKKTTGFTFDKTAPKISVKNGVIKVTDSGSGVKKITVNKKTVKNNKKLKAGKYTIVAYDKAGNKRVKKITVK